MIAKIFFVLGLVFIILGFIFYFDLNKYIPIGRLPGDIIIDRGNFKFYFPITTSIIISIILTLIFLLFK
jgi:hypothetical protein